jgi:hypothetical protein
MTTTTNRLASDTMARTALGVLAATALTAASLTPAMARDHRDEGISAGEIIAGAVVIGGIAALAGAFDGERRHYHDGYRGAPYGYRGGYGIGPRAAVERCVRAAENQARRGGYRYADVIDVRDIDRTRFGYRVRGRIDVGGGWGRRGNDSGSFTCRIDGRGQPFIDFDGVRGLRW